MMKVILFLGFGVIVLGGLAADDDHTWSEDDE